MSDQPQSTLQVVSAQMPCGAAWLANALLELGVAIENLWGFDTAEEWQTQDDGSRCYVATHDPWRQTLAALRTGRRFPPPMGPSTVFSHQLPEQLPCADRRILIVRDPRDALYSEWQRQVRNAGSELSFPAFLDSAFFGTQQSQNDYLFHFMSRWTEAWQTQSTPTLLVRFEDFKRRPSISLARICRWLTLDSDAAQIHRACSGSDVRHLQRIETELSAKNPLSRQFSRRGHAFEWRETWLEMWHLAFGTRWNAVLDVLRYPLCAAASLQASSIHGKRSISSRTPA